mmetsp:Transcript_102011/g.327302  ORF Transcript_102011/g.327302 Transcript_102011/m.327302 type:complete len:594 (-) Transcript_102011:7-1788(-)
MRGIGLRQDVLLGANPASQGHHDRLPDGIDGRVRHLREELVEILIARPRLPREDRQRGVVAHAAQSLLTIVRHGHHQQFQSLQSVAEGAQLRHAQGRLQRGHAVAGARLHERVHGGALFDPLPVRQRLRQLILDLVVACNLANGKIYPKHFSWRQAPFLDDVLGGDVRQHPALGSEDDFVVLRHVVAAWAQAVAVQRGADASAISEADQGRTVPRLHHRRVELEVVLLFGRQRRGVLPSLRHHHDHGFGKRPAGQGQDLQHVIKDSAIGLIQLNEREALRERGSKNGGLHNALARAHGIDVAAQRVDLAVVAQVAERVRPAPRREGVRGEAAVHQGDMRLEVLLQQVRVIARKTRAREHALVVDHAAGERAHIERRVGDLVHGLHGLLAQHEERGLEASHVRGQGPCGLDHALLDAGLEVPRGLAQAVRADRHLAPLHELEPGHGGTGGLEELLALVPAGRVARQEDVAGGVLQRRRELHAQELKLAAQEGVRDGAEHAGAIASVHLATAGATMVEVLQDQQGALHDAAGGLSPEVRDHADTAAVLLMLGIVQALRFREVVEVARRVDVGVRHRVCTSTGHWRNRQRAVGQEL